MSTIVARELLASLDVPGIRLGGWPADPVRRLPSGIAPLDDLLGGGLPRGHLSEIVGGPSSGRTALLHAWLAAATRAGEVAAVVDLPDALDPRSLARAGADLTRVLWVRPPSLPIALKCTELILSAGGFGLVALELGNGQRQTAGGRGKGGPSAFRLPLSASRSVWPRLAQVTRRAGAATIILTPRRVTTSCAAIALELTQRRARWNGRLFEGVTTDIEMTRSRLGLAQRAMTLSIGEQLAAIDGVKVQTLRAVRKD